MRRAASRDICARSLGPGRNEDFLDECELFSPDEREYETDDQVEATCEAFNLIKKPRPFEYIRIPRRGLFGSNDARDDDGLPRVTAGSGRGRNVCGAW